MKKVLNQLIPVLKKELGLYFGISFGVAFFVFIFRPFPIEHLDDDTQHLLKIGIGSIVFVSLILIRAFYHALKKKSSPSSKDPMIFSITSGFVIWIINLVALWLFLHTAGAITWSYYILFKLFLISLIPDFIMRIYDIYSELKQQNESIMLEVKIMQNKMDKNDEDILHKSVAFISENKSDQFSLRVNEILLFKAADNYVEIHYLNGDQDNKKLVRNTLKNLELQMSAYPEFVRCHRAYIVNTQYVEKLNGNYNHHELIIRGFDQQIPVSRKYYLKVKEAV